MPTVIQTPGSETLATVANGDVLIFERGNQTFTNGTDQSANAPGGLERIEFRKQSNVSFTADKPLKVDVDASGTACILFEQAGGTVYYQPSGTNSVCTRLRHLGTGTFHVIGGGTVTTWEKRAGVGRISDAVVLTNAYAIGGQTVIEKNATAITAGKFAGLVTCHRSFSGTLDVFGSSTRVMFSRRMPTDSLPTGGTLNIHDGIVVWAGGNITTLLLQGDGMFDFSQATQDITITNLICTAEAYQRSIFRAGQYKVTVTNFTPYGNEIDTFAA